MKSGVWQPQVILALGLRKEEAPGRQGEKTRGRGMRHRWAGKTVLGALLHAIDGQQADLSQLLVGKIGFLFGALAFLAADARFTRNLGQILFRHAQKRGRAAALHVLLFAEFHAALPHAATILTPSCSTARIMDL